MDGQTDGQTGHLNLPLCGAHKILQVKRPTDFFCVLRGRNLASFQWNLGDFFPKLKKRICFFSHHTRKLHVDILLPLHLISY